MKPHTENIKHYFFNAIYGKVTLNDFENWIYTNKEIESILDEDDYLELISFNYKKSGAEYELVHLLTKRYIDLGAYERWKILHNLYAALKCDDRLGSILREFYDLYCQGYEFLNDLGLGYGLIINGPPAPKYKVATWEELSEAEKHELIESFYPQIESDIKRAIDWIEGGKIIFTGKQDELCHYEYEDLRNEKERESTVWTEEIKDDKTGTRSFKNNLKIFKEINRPAKVAEPDKGFVAKLKHWFLS